jgi:hypothetical protein
MSALREAAQRYGELGWRVVPVAGKKPLVAWGDPPPPDQVDDLWDDPKTTGIAAVLGQPSGGLIVRDFDSVDVYREWCDEQSELAATLPTAQTPRPGRHVFARCDAELRTRRLRSGDGELRGDGGIVVLPPSIHANGKNYGWMRDPFREIPVVEPSLLVGPAQQPRQASRTPQEEDPVNTCSKHMACVNSEKELLIAWAIERTCPSGPGQRNQRIFQFARHLREVFVKTTDPEELRSHVEAWHRAALPFIRTKGFGETWRDFLHAWDSVAMPAGASLAMVEREAREDTFTLGLLDRNPDRVARLLRVAARLRGEDRVFYMDFRTMGRCAGLSAPAAREIAYKLVDMGLLEVVEKGTVGRRGTATVWRWLGP